MWFMDTESHEPQTTALTAGPWALPDTAARADGWTGDKMAIFCETLAETGLVVDACLAAGRSTNTAYATRRRNPMFAAAWEAALTIARERLADTLLARSIEGTVEQYYRDGELVGERKVIDNRLGLAILRRLDRMAETGSPLHSIRPGPIRARPEPVDGPARPIDWELALSALRSGEADAIAEALAMFKDNEARETRDPPVSLIPPAEPAGIDLSDRCWKDELEGLWLTDFPPPEGFEGWQSGDYGASGYERECSAEEVALLDADCAAAEAGERAEDETLRDAWFEMLKAELDASDHSQRPQDQQQDDDSADTDIHSDSP
jgi:hypothetical protein